MHGIPSVEISGNFTRTQITLVCRVQHCLEREQQTFPLEASFLFGAVQFAAEAQRQIVAQISYRPWVGRWISDTSFCCRNVLPRQGSQHSYFLKHYVIGLRGQ